MSHKLSILLEGTTQKIHVFKYPECSKMDNFDKQYTPPPSPTGSERVFTCCQNTLKLQKKKIIYKSF